jgi:hypothetical protein
MHAIPFQKCIDKAAVVVISTKMKTPQSMIKIPKPPTFGAGSTSSRCKKINHPKSGYSLI